MLIGGAEEGLAAEAFGGQRGRFHARGDGLFRVEEAVDVVLEAKVFANSEFVAGGLEIAHAVGAEVAVIEFGAVPGKEVPALEVEDEGHGLDFAIGGIGTASALIAETEDVALGESVLDGEKIVGG